ncbi:MAG: hypothetical protein K8R41_02070 [Bacteroidales bacterium]|nr:hypothetical protein [Bacteroidales bacterium]
MRNSFKYIIVLTVFCAALVIFFSCNKTPENTIPEVIIDVPVWNQYITIPDTIKVSGIATDSKGIESIKVVLVNKDFIPVQPPQYYYPHPVSENVKFELFYPIEEFSLDSDTYYIQVSAYDNESAKNKFQKVVINKHPAVLKKLIAITQASSITSDVYELNLNLEKQYLFSVAGKYQSSDISSKYQQLYFARNIPGRLQTYNLNTNEQDWQHNAGFPYPTFCDVFYENDRIYISSENGDIIGLNTSGQIKFNTPVMTDTFPENIFKHQDFMIADLKIRTGNDRLLAVYYMVSGSIKSNYISNFDVVEFFTCDDDNIFVFANYNEQAILKIYNISENYCWKPVNLPEGKMTAVERFDNEFLMCIGNNIEKYIISGNAVVPYLTGKQCDLILNNYFNNEVYFVENNTIEIYNYSSGSYLNEIVFDDELLKVHLLYK